MLVLRWFWGRPKGAPKGTVPFGKDLARTLYATQAVLHVNERGLTANSNTLFSVVCQLLLPMKDLGMVIFNHTRSFTSSPELEAATIFAMLYMGVVRVSFMCTRSPGENIGQ